MIGDDGPRGAAAQRATPVVKVECVVGRERPTLALTLAQAPALHLTVSLGYAIHAFHSRCKSIHAFGL